MSLNLCYEINHISYGEVQDGYDAQLSTAQPATAHRKLQCHWSDHLNLATYMMTANTHTVGSQTLILGAVHPNYTRLYCDSIGVHPFGLPTGEAAWEYATVDAGYSAYIFDPASPALLRTDTMELNGELLSINPKSAVFATGNVADTPPLVLMQFIKYDVNLQKLSSIPLSAIIACQNHYHSGTMSIKIGATTYSIAGNQVVYMGPSNIKKNIFFGGTTSYDITHSFLISPIDVNKKYNPQKTGSTVAAKFDTITPAPYASADLSTLGV